MARIPINVSKSASRRGLKEALIREANARGFKLSRLVKDILEFSLSHKSLYQSPIENPLERGGEHIATSVSLSVREGLNQWAEKRETPRSELVSFVLEKTVYEIQLTEVYSHLSDEDDGDTEN